MKKNEAVYEFRNCLSRSSQAATEINSNSLTMQLLFFYLDGLEAWTDSVQLVPVTVLQLLLKFTYISKIPYTHISSSYNIIFRDLFPCTVYSN
jgi:hypothetical protein